MLIDPDKKTPSSTFPLAWKVAAFEDSGTYDLVANQFETNTTENISVVPVGAHEPWETVNTLSAQFMPSLILGIFPSFSQIEFRFHRAVRALGMPTCTYEEAQISIAASIVDELGVNAVITRTSKLETVSSIIKKSASSSILYYQAILSVHEVPTSIDLPVFYEQHLVPGMVGLFQCEYLAKEGNGYMHFNDRFSWHIVDSMVQVTDMTKVPRFVRATLPRSYSIRHEQCACGANRSAKPL